MPAAPPFLITTDQLQRPVTLPHQPRRIVSLVPSQTELLHDLGLAAQLVGVTKFCVHPATARQTAQVIGGTKQFDFAKIAACRPDLILGNKEENYLAGITQLAADFPVWLSDITSLADALDMIRRMGELTGRTTAAADMAANIGASFAPSPPVTVSAAYFIWRKPYMVAAADTFINHMLAQAGFRNVFAHLRRYPEITPDQLAAAQPQQILLSSEPYPFQAKHLAEFQALCPTAEVRVVDGEMFSWYGSRLRYAAAYFHQLRAE